MKYFIAILKDPEKEPPKKDGEYGVISKDGNVNTIYYCVKYEAFNVCSHSTLNNRIKVKYWFDLPKIEEMEDE